MTARAAHGHTGGTRTHSHESQYAQSHAESLTESVRERGADRALRRVRRESERVNVRVAIIYAVTGNRHAPCAAHTAPQTYVRALTKLKTRQ